MNIRTGYKAFAHDYSPPIQGGDPVFDGQTPFILPKTELVTTNDDCGAGWNYCKDLATVFKIVGLWRSGRPVNVFYVEAGEDAIERGQKRRSSELTIVRECYESEIHAAIEEMSEPFGRFKKEMTEQQILWGQALSRPYYNKVEVENGLLKALEVRGLKDWKLREFQTTQDARDARAAWDARDAWDAWVARAAWDARDAWVARAAWDARDAWDAWVARAAWDARDAWDARAARDAWDARDAWAARAARDARAARAAWDALTVYYSGSMTWTNQDPLLLTSGLREAYLNGLELVIPVGKNELGYVIKEKD